MELNGSPSFHTWNWIFTVVCDALAAILKMLILLLVIHQDQLMNHLLWSAFPDYSANDELLLCASLSSECALSMCLPPPLQLLISRLSVHFPYLNMNRDPWWRGSPLLVLHWSQHIIGWIMHWLWIMQIIRGRVTFNKLLFMPIDQPFLKIPADFKGNSICCLIVEGLCWTFEYLFYIVPWHTYLSAFTSFFLICP